MLYTVPFLLFSYVEILKHSHRVLIQYILSHPFHFETCRLSPGKAFWYPASRPVLKTSSSGVHVPAPCFLCMDLISARKQSHRNSPKWIEQQSSKSQSALPAWKPTTLYTFLGNDDGWFSSSLKPSLAGSAKAALHFSGVAILYWAPEHIPQRIFDIPSHRHSKQPCNMDCSKLSVN